MPCGVGGNHGAGLQGWGQDVEEEEKIVPGNDEDIDEEAGDFMENTHVYSAGGVRLGKT